MRRHKDIAILISFLLLATHHDDVIKYWPFVRGNHNGGAGDLRRLLPIMTSSAMIKLFCQPYRNRQCGQFRQVNDMFVDVCRRLLFMYLYRALAMEEFSN